MSYDEDEQELDNLLRQWGLYGKKETWIEDLDFDDHIDVYKRQVRVLWLVYQFAL